MVWNKHVSMVTDQCWWTKKSPEEMNNCIVTGRRESECGEAFLSKERHLLLECETAGWKEMIYFVNQLTMIV